MTDSPGEAARFLTRNAVDALPEGELERQLGEGPPAAREARRRPHHARHPPRPHGRAAQAARVPGPRPHGGADHRRLHRRAWGTRAAARRCGRQLDPAEIDRNAETYQEQAFKVLDRDAHRGAPQRRVARHADGGPVPRSRAPPPSPSCSSATTSPSATPRREPISILELLYPLLQGYDSVAIDVGRRARRHRPEVQPAARARRPAGVRGASRSRSSRMPILPGIDGVQKMSKSLGNYVGVDRAARGDVREADARPRRGDAGLLRAAAGRAARPVACRRVDAKRALARALTARFHGEEAAAAAEERFDRLHVRARAARRDRGVRLRRQRRTPCTCRRCWRTPSGCRARRRAGCWRRRGVKLDGEALGDGRARPAGRSASTARCSRWASAASSGCGALAPGPSRLGVPSAVLHCSVAPQAPVAIPTPEGARSLKTQQCTRPPKRTLRKLSSVCDRGRVRVASRFDPRAIGPGPEQDPSSPAFRKCTRAPRSRVDET